jgi:predicted transcriptional regulator
LSTRAHYPTDRAGRRKRNRYELLADLLQSSKGGARKTNLMFRANLSFVLLNKYLNFLLEKGFLESKDGFFFPTREGLTYLQRFARYSRARDSMKRSEEKVVSSLTVSRPAVAPAPS